MAQESFIAVVHNTDQAIPLSIPNVDLSAKRIIARITDVPPGNNQVSQNTIELNSEDALEVDMTNAATGVVLLKITEAQSIVFPLNKALTVYFSIFNANDTMYARGSFAAKVVL
jgi:hypothetical protein